LREEKLKAINQRKREEKEAAKLAEKKAKQNLNKKPKVEKPKVEKEKKENPEAAVKKEKKEKVVIKKVSTPQNPSQSDAFGSH